MEYLVSVDWLSQNLKLDNLILLDASLAATAEGKSASLKDFYIPGARKIDLKNKFSDQEAPFPNTLPSPAQFEGECQALGINRESKIVVYDNMGVYSSPRIWWMFKVMGHDSVAVLDGGLPAWVEVNHPTSSDIVESTVKGDFKAKLQSHWIKSYEEVKGNLTSQEFQIIDARSAGRFNGTAEEPRKHLKSGHIDQSANIPYQDVLREGRFKSEKELKALFSQKVGDREELVFSCGSGLTACIIMLAGQIAGKESKAVYDGSWTEWAELEGLRTDNP